jgi:hypothetical protein
MAMSEKLGRGFTAVGLRKRNAGTDHTSPQWFGILSTSRYDIVVEICARRLCLPEYLSSSQLLKKFPALYGT